MSCSEIRQTIIPISYAKLNLLVVEREMIQAGFLLNLVSFP